MQLRLVNFIPIIFVLLWSTGFIGAKYALPYIEPFNLLFIRMSITVVVFYILCKMLKVQWIPLSEAKHQMVTGVLIHGCYLGGVFAAIKLGMPAGIAAIVVGVQPILTALLAIKWLNNTLTTTQWIGLLLGFVGMVGVLLLTRQNNHLQFGWPAMLAVLVSLFAISVGTLYQKRYGGGVSLLAGSFWQYVSTAIFMGLLTVTFESREVIWAPQLILALAWLIFGLSVTAILLLMYMIREGEASKVASYFYLVAPITSIEAWLLFNESLPILAVCAAVLTIYGVYLVAKKPMAT